MSMSRSPSRLRVAEGRAMVEAVKRHGRVCQAGMHRRSSAMCREMAEFVRGGGLGKVTGVRVLPHPERVAEGHRQSARQRAAG